jgi:hypothetical protein
MYGSPQSYGRDFEGYDQEEFDALGAAEEAAWLEDGYDGEWELGEIETRRQDPVALAIAERVVAREADFESDSFHKQPKKKTWTTCFTWADAAKVNQVYVDNKAAADGNKIDRCSCIVMLNVALGQLLSLPKRRNRARGKSNRIVNMGNLTTETIEKAMAQLRTRGYALKPTEMDFLNARGGLAGTLKPEKLKASVRDKVLQLARGGRCWYAFGLSIMDGYHSVLLLVDCTIGQPRIYWLDQNSPGISDNVTASLDQRLLEWTRNYWQGVWDKRKVGYKTTLRLWPLRKLI